MIRWFDNGGQLNLPFDITDGGRLAMLHSVDGLHALVKQFYRQAGEAEIALLMEFVLHGLAAHSLISKKMLEGGVGFKDLMGSMLNIGNAADEQDEEEGA